MGVVGRNKYDHGAIHGQGGGYTEPIELRHVDIQEDRVGSSSLNLLQPSHPVARLADHLDAMAREHAPQALSSQSLVVDKNDAQHQAACGFSRGMTMTARAP